MVPQKVLDTELKKSFAHFNEGRIPVSISSTETHSEFDLLHRNVFCFIFSSIYNRGHRHFRFRSCHGIYIFLYPCRFSSERVSVFSGLLQETCGGKKITHSSFPGVNVNVIYLKTFDSSHLPVVFSCLLSCL